MIPSPKRLLADSAGVKPAETVVETVVSQQAGPSMPQPELQSAPVGTLPEAGGTYDVFEHTRYRHVLVAATNGGDAGAERAGGGDEPHVASLDRHLDGRLELPGSVGGPVELKILLDSGSGVTGLFKAMCHRLRQQWPGVDPTKPYTRRMMAQVADGRKMDLEQQTLPLQLNLLLKWGDGQRRHANNLIVCGGTGSDRCGHIGDQTLRVCLGIDVEKQVKEKMQKLRGAGTAKAGPAVARGNAEEQARERAPLPCEVQGQLLGLRKTGPPCPSMRQAGPRAGPPVLCAPSVAGAVCGAGADPHAGDDSRSGDPQG